jgi:hypothetical protein
LLEDPEAWILRQLPGGKGRMLVSLFAILGGFTVGLGAALFALVRLWATAAPDLTDEEEEELIDTRTWGPATDPNRAVSVRKSGW